MNKVQEMQELVREQLYSRFNIILSEFILSLIETYPHDASKLRKTYNKLQLVLIATPYLPLDEFATHVTPEIDTLITDNNETLFELDDIKSNQMMKDLCILSNWAITPDDTKEVIWTYLSAFSNLSTTFNGIASHASVELDNIPDTIRKVSEDIICELETNGRSVEEIKMPELFMSVAKKLGVDCDDFDMSTFDEDLQSVHDMLTTGNTSDTSAKMKNFIRDQVHKSNK